MDGFVVNLLQKDLFFDGGFINFFEEMLIYQKVKLVFMVGFFKFDFKVDIFKCESGFEYFKSFFFYEDSKVGKGKKVGKCKGGKCKGGKNIDCFKFFLMIKLVVKDEFVVVDKEQFVKIEIFVGFKYQVDVKVGIDDCVNSKVSIKVEVFVDIEYEYKVKFEFVVVVEIDEIYIDVGENDFFIKIEIKEENVFGFGYGFEFKSLFSFFIKVEIKEESVFGFDCGIDFKSLFSFFKIFVKVED